MVFGVMQKHLHLTGWKETVAGLACTVAALAIGMAFPLVAGKDTWSYLTFAYIFMAAVMPMWLLMQPRDYMTTFMFAGMIIGAVVGLPPCGICRQVMEEFMADGTVVLSNGKEIKEYTVRELLPAGFSAEDMKG